MYSRIFRATLLWNGVFLKRGQYLPRAFLPGLFFVQKRSVLKKCRKITFLIGGIPYLPALLKVTASDINEKLLIVTADDHYSCNEFEAIYELLLPFKDSGNDEILWRLARATYELAKVSSASTGPDKLREAFSYVKEALAINDKNFAVHKWMAILVDEVAALDGSKARIIQSFVMRDHMERACELNPSDATSLYLLGMWHYNIANIPWYQRKAAALLFASPPQSSYEEALRVFLKAEEVEPNFYSQNLLMIGKCYLELQDKIQASEYLHRAIQSALSAGARATRDDRSALEEAEALLRKHGLATT